jgi:hypothetical protein
VEDEQAAVSQEDLPKREKIVALPDPAAADQVVNANRVSARDRQETPIR